MSEPISATWSEVALSGGVDPKQLQWQREPDPNIDLPLLLSLSRMSQANFPVFDSDAATNELENIPFAPLRSLNLGLFQSLTDSLKFLADFEVPDESPESHIGRNLNFVKNISDTTLLVARILPLSRDCIFTDGSDESEIVQSQKNTLAENINELHRTDSFVVNFYECTRDDIARVSSIKKLAQKGDD
jgi:hypothetical protein